MLIVLPSLLYSYIPWNLHEPQRGTFDFSGDLDLEYMLLLLLWPGLAWAWAWGQKGAGRIY